MHTLLLALLLTGIPPLQQMHPTLDELVAPMSRYVAGYGEQASLIVAVEKYQQNVLAADLSVRRQLTAEFVIVRTDGGAGWMGFRDVNEVDGRNVTERRDRLQKMLIGQTVDASAVTKIAKRKLTLQRRTDDTELQRADDGAVLLPSDDNRPIHVQEGGHRQDGGSRRVANRVQGNHQAHAGHET